MGKVTSLVKEHLYWVVRYKSNGHHAIQDTLRMNSLEEAIEHTKKLEEMDCTVLGILRVEQTVTNELVIKED
jgi:hypothetical protein